MEKKENQQVQEKAASKEKDDSDSDIDEIQVMVRDKAKRRLIIKLPDGKKLKLDIRLEE